MFDYFYRRALARKNEELYDKVLLSRKAFLGEAFLSLPNPPNPSWRSYEHSKNQEYQIGYDKLAGSYITLIQALSILPTDVVLTCQKGSMQLQRAGFKSKIVLQPTGENDPDYIEWVAEFFARTEWARKASMIV